MGQLNNIFNSLRVISEGSNYNTTGFTVTYSGTGLPIPAGTNTSFMVRDGGYVGIGTNLPNDGIGGRANLHVVGNARVTNIPTGGKVYLTTDIHGNILQNTSIPIVPLSGDCVVSSAYTAGVSGCTLYIITSCTGNTAPGRLLVNGYISYTANTCSEFGASFSPYEYRGINSISTVLPGNGNVGDNYVKSNMVWSNIGGGGYNKLNTSGPGYNNIAGGYDNTIGGSNIKFPEGNTGYAFIGGGYKNKIRSADQYYAGIGSGIRNWVLNSQSAFIGGGSQNIITGGTVGFIGAGNINKIFDAYSSIVGGTVNTVYSSYSNIGGGTANTVGSPIGGNTAYAGIFNGSGNTIGRNAEYAAIIGARGINYASSPETTYMKGLDANTNGYNGIPRPFRYHGTYANQGIGKVLTDSTGGGDAVWSRNTSPGVSFSGDQFVTTAYTVNCTLFIVTNSGNTFTADTCNTFNEGPYEFGSGFNSIQPKLGNNLADGYYSNIGGGLNNQANQVGLYNSISSGIDNKISGYSVSVIVQGHHNRITGNNTTYGYSSVLNGYQNTVTHKHSTILNGINVSSTRDHTVFANGLELNTLDGNGTQQPFKYYGLAANPGVGRVLTSDALGNASWENGSPGATWTGDCAVVSAYTQGCLLYMMTDCTGTTVGSISVNGYVTFTADTCNTFSNGPYEYATGGACSVNSIKPVLGSNILSGITSSITGGQGNKILGGCNTMYSNVGGGLQNAINTSSYYSSILGGGLNQLGVTMVGGATPVATVNLSTIVGGAGGKITGATYSTILGGNNNKVYGTNSVRVQYAAIINGLSNTVKHDGSVIMNGPSLTSDDTYTTYTRGLNVDSVLSTGGAKYLKYHGALANPGFGKVLVDSTGAGDAVWADGGIFSFSGDQYVTTAYTSGCTLYITTNSGNTFTANTCSTFGGVSPYEYRGVNSISTVLPGNGNVGDNFIKNSMAWSNIGGGYENKLNTSGPGYNNIAGGYDNVIGGTNIKISLGNSAYSFIGGGYSNRLTGGDTYYDVISGGYENRLHNGGFTFLGGGRENIITGATSAGIVGGKENIIWGGGDQSSIVGGYHNTVFSHSSVIGGGAENTIGSPIGGNTSYAGIFNGSGNTIGRNAEYAAIIGARGINYASSPETTYLKGLDANTNGYDGTNRPLKYHGSYANQGVGKVLTSDVAGNASWQNPGFINGLTGDCVVATAYTINCILYMVTSCTGTTTPGRLLVGDHIAYTANTCQTFGGTSPYEYGSGVMATGAIQPILGNNQANIWHTNIAGGENNAIHYGSYDASIGGGWGNMMTAATQSAIVNGQQNTIKTGFHSMIGSGYQNYLGAINKQPGGSTQLGTMTNRSFIGSGEYNEILSSDESFIGSGQYNLLRKTYQSFLGGGDHNILTGDSGSVLVGGYYNTMKSSLRSFIGGGANNELYDGQYNTIVGGFNHHINNSGNNNFIGGGDSNILGDISGEGFNTDFSSILGGKNNKIAGDGTADYAAIVNGQSNTVTASYAAIIGGQSLTANRRHTTFMNGLDVDVASSSGIKYFRYHGAGSNVGTAGDVLTSINASGDAIWSTPTAPGASFTGDCAVVSAYTSGCLLYMITDCTGATGSQYIVQGGNIVYTANTCNSQGTGPYRFGPNNGIEPILGVNNSDGFRTSIGGGQNNTVNTTSAWSNVGAGVSNTITDSRVSSILGGHQNTINIPGTSDGYGAIINGYQNQVTHAYSVVMGGSGIVSDKSHTAFMNGLDVDTNATGVNRYLKYHGTLASPGLNNILTDVDGTGNAVWRKNTSPGVSFSGDQYVTSAYTSGCTLYILTNSGNTFTANTCNVINESPYQYGTGAQSIRPKLGAVSTLSPFASIGGGDINNINEGNYYSRIGSGLQNTIDTKNEYSYISGGISNTIRESSTYSSIIGGGINVINTSAYGSIVGGYQNQVRGTNNGSILGGAGNIITGGTFGAIVGGVSNRLEHSRSIILGGGGIVSDRNYTTFTHGLDVNTDTPSTNQYFKYHGTLATVGLGRILTSDAVGNASWQALSTPGVSFSGDQYVVSAYTTGCTLHITTNSGNTFTANTCNDFSDSPYEYRGFNSISTKLPGGGNVGDNFIRTSAAWSNIGGGYENKLNTFGPGYNNIAGGYDNVIGGNNIKVAQGNAGYSFIGGGKENRLRGSDHYYDVIGGGQGNQLYNGGKSSILGGVDNIITGASTSVIAGGASNKIENNTGNSSILGGVYNTVYSSTSVIAGGQSNTIGQLVGGSTKWAGIFNGSGNTIGRNAEYAAVIGSRGINYASSPETTYMKGLDVNTNGYDGTDRPFKYHGTFANQGTVGYVLTSADAAGNAHWQPGNGIPSTGSDEVVISADTSGCTITFFTNSGNTFTANTCNGGYSPYRPTGTNSIVPTLPGIGIGSENIISANSDWSNVGGGLNNRITQGSDRSIIAGGQNNSIVNGSDWSNISGGVVNKIDDSRVSSILGGHQNTINIPGTSNGYGAIVAGFGNTVGHQYSTILNGQNVTTNLSYMAYIKGGLNINTQSASPRHFRYHGTLANEGASKILTSDANGNATWQNSGMIGYSGDQFVVSAYTTGCTLHVVTNSGNTFTANTCNTMNTSPYEYGGGINSVVPKLPSIPGQQNTIAVNCANSVITGGMANNISGKPGNTISGGYYNDIGSTHYWGSIVGGYENKLTGTGLEQCTSIVGGWNNEIYNHQRSFIAGGKDNLIFSTVGSSAIDGHASIIGGTANNISGATHSSIIGGKNNVLRSEANYSVILGGGVPITGSTPSTAYMTNSQTMGKARIASHNYLSTNGLHNQSPITALDVVHETTNLTGMADNTGGGEIVRFGIAGGDYAKGYLVQLQNNNWVKADAADVSYQGNMLGIALGSTPEEGILIRGHYTLSTPISFSPSAGNPLYVSATDGQMTDTPPSTVSQYVRAIGYQEIVKEGPKVVIYFNPDSTYITLQ